MTQVSASTRKVTVTAINKSPLAQLVAAAAPEDDTVPAHVFHRWADFLQVAPNGLAFKYLEDLRRMASGTTTTSETPEVIRGAAAASTTTPPDQAQLVAMQRQLAIKLYRYYNPDDRATDAALGHVRIPATTSTVESQVTIANTIANTPGAQWRPAPASKPVMERFLSDYVKYGAVVRRMNAVHASELYKDFDDLARRLTGAGKDDLAGLTPAMVQRFTENQALAQALYLQVPKMVMVNVATPAESAVTETNSKQLDNIQAVMASMVSPADRARAELFGSTASAVKGTPETKKKPAVESKGKEALPRSARRAKPKTRIKVGLSRRPTDTAAGGAAAGQEKMATFATPTKGTVRADGERHGKKQHRSPKNSGRKRPSDAGSGGETPRGSSGGKYVRSPASRGDGPKNKKSKKGSKDQHH